MRIGSKNAVEIIIEQSFRRLWRHHEGRPRNPGKERKSRPISRVLSRTAIHLGCKSPYSSSNLPRDRAGHASVPLFDLAPGGVYHATPVTSCAVRSYRTFSPLPVIKTGGIFSAALSVGSHLPGVTWHPAQWSPDFPPFYLAIKQRLLSRLFQ